MSEVATHDTPAGDSQAQVPEVEQKARQMGWMPKDEFKGDPDKWRPAAEFVQRGETLLPIVKAQVKRQESKIAELERTIKEFGEFHSKVATQAYERAVRELKAKQEAAVEVGDVAAFKAVDAEIERLNKERVDPPKVEPKATTEADPVFEAWLEDNAWYKDRKMARRAELIAQELREDGDTTSGRAFLDKVRDAVRAEFPAKFENPKRSAPPAVEGAGGQVRGKGKSFADLPQEAKDAYARWERNGVKISKDQYVKDFFGE